MNIPKELIEQWRTEYYRSATPSYLPEYIAQRAAEWALEPVSNETVCARCGGLVSDPVFVQEPVSMEPVAWKYKVDPSFDGSKWTDVYEITQSKQVADWKAGGSAMPLFTTTQLAAARQQGAEEERKNANVWVAGIVAQRIAELEKSNAQLLEALKISAKAIQEYRLQGAPTAYWDDVEAQAHAAIKAAEVKP